MRVQSCSTKNGLIEQARFYLERDDDVGDKVAVPDGLEYAVGETQHHQVLHHLLS